MHLIRGCSFQHLEAACLETQDQRELWHVDISLSGFSFSSCTSHLHSSLTSHATPVSAWCKKKKRCCFSSCLLNLFFFSLRCWITFTYGLVFKFRAELFFLFSCAARSCWPHIGHVRSAYASEHLYIACFFFFAPSFFLEFFSFHKFFFFVPHVSLHPRVQISRGHCGHTRLKKSGQVALIISCSTTPGSNAVDVKRAVPMCDSCSSCSQRLASVCRGYLC